MIFYITFGQASPMKDGWIAVEASSELEARKHASQYPHWCGCYREDHWPWVDFEAMKRKYFPLGQIGETVHL